jgi:hypothetical protein
MTDAQLLILLRKYRDMLVSAQGDMEARIEEIHEKYTEELPEEIRIAEEREPYPGGKTFLHKSYPVLDPLAEMVDIITRDVEDLEKVLESGGKK